MIWFYERGKDALRLETRFDEATKEYVLDIAWANRPAETERFADLASFRSRVERLEAQLAAESWTQVGGPEILPHGWRGPTTH